MTTHITHYRFPSPVGCFLEKTYVDLSRCDVSWLSSYLKIIITHACVCMQKISSADCRSVGNSFT